MAFNCYCIDFKNKTSGKNINFLKEKFPNLKIVPFVKNYKQLIDFALRESNTQYTWIVSTLIDYKEFDFDFYRNNLNLIKYIHGLHSIKKKEILF